MKMPAVPEENMHPRFILSLVCAAFALLFSSFVEAGPPRSAEELSQLSDKALANAQNGDMTGAIEIWLDILDEVSDSARPDIHANLAVAYKMSGSLPEAWYHLTTYLATCGRKDPAASKELQQLEQQLAVKFGKVQVTCQPDDAVVYLTMSTDQPTVGSGPTYPCPLTWWFLGGNHELFVVSDGFQSQRITVTASVQGTVGKTTAILIPNKAVAGPTDDLAIDSNPDQITIPGGAVAKVADLDKFPVWQTVLMAGGAALLLAGGVMNIVAYDANETLQNKYPEKELDYALWAQNQEKYKAEFDESVQPKRIATYVLYGVGGTAAAAGFIWLVMDMVNGGSADSGSGVSLAPLDPSLGFGLSMDMGF